MTNEDHLARLESVSLGKESNGWIEAEIAWAVKTIRKLQGRARPCTHGYHPIFVRENGSIVAHYHENGARCPASETLYPEASVDERDKTIRSQESRIAELESAGVSKTYLEQAEEVKRLREALEQIIRRVALVSPYYEIARAALARKS